MKKLIITVLFAAFVLAGCASAPVIPESDGNSQKISELDNEIGKVAAQISVFLPKDSRVLIADFTGLDNKITYFGRYFSEKLQCNIAGGALPVKVVERNKIGISLEELKLQNTGLVNDSALIKFGEMVGANVVVFGTITELEEVIDIQVKVMNIEKSVLLTGFSYKINKTRQIATLINTVIKSEKEIETEIERQKKQLINELKAEENNKRLKLKELDNEIREKSEIIQKYEEKKKKLTEMDDYLKKVVAEIDRVNKITETSLRLGMTVKQVEDILGTKLKVLSENNYLLGKYQYIFHGGILESIYEINAKGMFPVQWIK